MSHRHSNPWMRRLPILLAAGALVALGAWLAPKRIEGLALVDGSQNWLTGERPLPRQVVWQPPAEWADFVPPRDPPDEVSHPHWSDGGTTLYFTLRRARGDGDLYRTRFTDGRWERAVPLVELNTPSDEVGASVSADGSELYLASNRPGGEGGFDLYVSRRTKTGWGLPQSLGKSINTSADEVDAALTPDGRRLFFASDRSGSQAKTDLYVVLRPEPDKAWDQPAAVGVVNLAGSNERGASVSPDGAFLYFSSDRPVRKREAANFDLYRARLAPASQATGASEFGKPENLGPSINTSADELGAALAADNFALLLASNRPSPDNARRWAIYRSTAAEVERVAAWDAGHWQSFTAIGWQALGVAIALAALAAAVRYRRAWLPELAAMTRFVIAGFLLHALVVALMLLTPVGQRLAERARFVRLTMTASRLRGPVEYRADVPLPQAYERVAAPPGVDTVAMSPTTRQVVVPPAMPDDAVGLAARLPVSQTIVAGPYVDPGREPATAPRRGPMVGRQEFEPPRLAADVPEAREMPKETLLAQPVDIAGTAPEAAGPQRTPAPVRLVVELNVEPARYAPEMARDAPATAVPTRAPLARSADPGELSIEVSLPPGKQMVNSPFPMVETRLDTAETEPSPPKVTPRLPQIPLVRETALSGLGGFGETNMGPARSPTGGGRLVRATVQPAEATTDEVKLAAVVRAASLELPQAATEKATLERRDAPPSAPRRATEPLAAVHLDRVGRESFANPPSTAMPAVSSDRLGQPLPRREPRSPPSAAEPPA
jgi:hypothetical protein